MPKKGFEAQGKKKRLVVKDRRRGIKFLEGKSDNTFNKFTNIWYFTNIQFKKKKEKKIIYISPNEPES